MIVEAYARYLAALEANRDANERVSRIDLSVASAADGPTRFDELEIARAYEAEGETWEALVKARDAYWRAVLSHTRTRPGESE